VESQVEVEQVLKGFATNFANGALANVRENSIE
jgi:hypothetical protein